MYIPISFTSFSGTLNSITISLPLIMDVVRLLESLLFEFRIFQPILYLPSFINECCPNKLNFCLINKEHVNPSPCPENHLLSPLPLPFV